MIFLIEHKCQKVSRNICSTLQSSAVEKIHRLSADSKRLTLEYLIKEAVRLLILGSLVHRLALIPQDFLLIFRLLVHRLFYSMGSLIKSRTGTQNLTLTLSTTLFHRIQTKRYRSQRRLHKGEENTMISTFEQNLSKLFKDAALYCL